MNIFKAILFYNLNLTRIIFKEHFLLQWELFRLNELEYFDALLRRLYKQDLEQIVMAYEFYRNALNRELERRKDHHQHITQQQNQHMQLVPFQQSIPLQFLQHQQLQQHLQHQQLLSHQHHLLQHQQFHPTFQHQQQLQQQQLQQQQQRLLTQNIETKV